MAKDKVTEKEKKPQKERFRRFKKFLSFLGIEITRGEKHPYHLHLSSLFFFWLIGIFFFIIVANIGLYTYSTNPNFCNSCHIMTPYYEAWKTSTHFGKAKCVDCHYPPAATLGEHLWHKFQATAQVVKYITRTYSSKPFAEIDDASCLRSGCHSTRLLDGKVKTKLGVNFDHRPHLTETRRGRKLRCVSCHSQIVVGNHLEVTYSTCYLCHFRGQGTGKELEPIGGCTGCHELPKKSFQLGNMSYNHEDFVTKRGIACKNCHIEIVKGEGKAEKDRCFTCHNQPEKLARYEDMAFIHESHVTKHHVACLHCHHEMTHGSGEMESDLMPRMNKVPGESSEFEKPHLRTLAFDCAFCHENKHAGQREMYAGLVKSLDLPEMPSPMYLANVDCIGCHYKEKAKSHEKEFSGVTTVAESTACIKCHGESFRGIWTETRVELKGALDELKKKIDLVQSSISASLEKSKKSQWMEKLQKAKRWFEFVRISHGEHNIYLTSVTLRKMDSLLSEIGTSLGVSLPDLSSVPLLSGGYCAMMCHDKVGVKVPPETVTAFGKKMPHKMHTEMMGCVNCHEIAGHKEVPLLKGAQETVCVGCH